MIHRVIIIKYLAIIVRQQNHREERVCNRIRVIYQIIVIIVIRVERVVENNRKKKVNHILITMHINNHLDLLIN